MRNWSCSTTWKLDTSILVLDCESWKLQNLAFISIYLEKDILPYNPLAFKIVEKIVEEVFLSVTALLEVCFDGKMKASSVPQVFIQKLTSLRLFFN